MPLLNIVSPEKAEGEVKECYDFFKQFGSDIPLPVQMASVSPFYLKGQIGNIQYIMKHPTLSFALMAHIRLLVAQNEDYPYCIRMNRGMLKVFAGLTDQQLDAALNDTANTTLPPKEQALLDFVLKVVQDPAASTQAQVDALKDHGWTDTDIFDAVMQGINMVGAGMMFKILKMGE